MDIKTSSFDIQSKADTSIYDITSGVQASLEKANLGEGTVTIFVPGSTAAITTVEFEPGLVKDLKVFFERLIPKDGTVFPQRYMA